MEIHFLKADPCLGYLRAVKTNFADEVKVSPLPFRCFPQVLVNNEVPMHFYIKRFPLQRLHDFLPTCNRICDLRD